MARILGIDPGSVRCGIALSDSSSTMAFPRAALANSETLIAQICELVDDENVTMVVVGRPLALSGGVTPSTETADALYARLVEKLGAPRVRQCDERLTTVQAQRSLSQAGVRAKHQREHIDSASAVIMLQHFIDGSRAE